MKRMALSFLLIIGISAAAFSVEENWLSVGGSFGNYFDRGSDIGNFYYGSSGVNLNAYGFSNQNNIGAFVNLGLQYPVVNNIGNNYQPIVQTDLLFGVGFRYSINERLKLHFGAGPNISFLALEDKANDNEKTEHKRIMLGIGGDAGLKYDITDVIYIDFGTILLFNFAGHSWVDSTLDNWTNTRRESYGWISGNTMFGIRPYIAIGFNYYQESGKWGKPDR